jgi:hypothetical protein
MSLFNIKTASERSHTSTRLALALFGCACAFTAQPAWAGVSYSEAVSGDLSNSGLTPTSVSVGLGQNQVFGSTGRAAGVVDRDYFTLTVPAGLQLTSIVVLPGTTTAGSVSFIGMESGNQVTLPTSAATAAGLLGWKHYTPGNGNILPDMAIPANGSSGFTPPLSAGSYAFWVQELGTGSFDYGFDFGLEAVATQNVPDAGPGLLGCAAVGALVAFGRRRLRTAA